jgi:ribonuclease D
MVDDGRDRRKAEDLPPQSPLANTSRLGSNSICMQYKYITTSEELNEYCRALASCKSIAFDTEFVSEHTYRPVLCLVQVSADDELAAIDAIQIGDLTPFWELIAAEGHETIVHAGRGEMEFCLHAAGRRPAGLFDVQIAAGLVGVEYPAGYGTLVSKLLGHKFSKHETRTDWRRRPLSKRQIEYALTDALHLPALRRVLGERLDDLGRQTWMEEEMALWQDQAEKSILHDRWHKVSGNTGLDSRALAVLREIYRWRDAEAKRRNQPARRVLRDDLIVELARRGTADPARIGALRGMERGDLTRRMDEIAACIQRGLDLPEEKLPVKIHASQMPQLSVLGQFLFAALGSICRQEQLAPTIVGTPNDIRELIAYDIRKVKPKTTPRLAQGWRKQFVGHLFDELLSGKVAIRVADPTADAPLTFEGAEDYMKESAEQDSLTAPRPRKHAAGPRNPRRHKE